METDKMIHELRRLEEKHKDDRVFTGENNWALMCHDVANKLQELQTANIKLEKERKFMTDLASIQTEYTHILKTKSLTKSVLCKLITPFRDTYSLTDSQALQLTRNELSITEINTIIHELFNIM